MNLRLAIVTAARATDCSLTWLDQAEELTARYSPAFNKRLKTAPQQLVAVDTATKPPTVMWRWFRGVVLYRRASFVVVDNEVYQPGFRIPIGVMRLPDILEVEIHVGDEVYYSHTPGGVVIDIVANNRPAHPARIATDLFPAIADMYAEFDAQGEA